jgi:hypothetical protein
LNKQQAQSPFFSNGVSESFFRKEVEMVQAQIKLRLTQQQKKTLEA